jgi:hypothetical protein
MIFIEQMPTLGAIRLEALYHPRARGDDPYPFDASGGTVATRRAAAKGLRRRIFVLDARADASST